MRIGLLTEGGRPHLGGDAGLWCDRLVRGLGQHEFAVYTLHPDDPCDDGIVHGRRARGRFLDAYSELAAAICSASPSTAEADRFGNALYTLAELARDEGGLPGALRSERAVRTLERACRAPGARPAAHEARVPDLLAVADRLERALRPLSLPWYDADALGAVDLCHAASGGVVALPGLLAGHFFGVPLVVTEYGVRLRAQYLESAESARSAEGEGSGGGAREGDGPHRAGAPVRALLAAFHGRLAAEVYRGAARITPGNAHARRWQERCGADPAKLRTVHPGLDARPFAEAGEAPDTADPRTLVWVGRIEPAKDLVSLLHAFAEVRRQEPGTRLRVVGTPADAEGAAYLGHCRALAAQLFPDEAPGSYAVGDNPVSFEEPGGPELPGAAEAYAAGAVVVLSSVVEGFPDGLVEAMLCGRATVSTDVGAVVEAIGGTGLVVPPRNPRALAEACVALLRDPERRARLGAAARARALELFTVEQNVAAFDAIYLDVVSRCPVRRVVVGEDGEPMPFGVPAEAHLAGRWTGRRVPGWAVAGGEAFEAAGGAGEGTVVEGGAFEDAVFEGAGAVGGAGVCGGARAGARAAVQGTAAARAEGTSRSDGSCGAYAVPVGVGSGPVCTAVSVVEGVL
ncbi:glycosyltransferase [Streptomyces acidiscabies]|uniref:glycosyltransferase n=1 Tax=Streptomyces acidiscabies TaxID=42234 RepID=UPI0009673457|nr:glycosyltransferase [Streptomyces acidiscabies]GAV42911.1 D-inositol 3-phosphate glycosyltransferase [Streptomyces acidiscabies]